MEAVLAPSSSAKQNAFDQNETPMKRRRGRPRKLLVKQEVPDEVEDDPYEQQQQQLQQNGDISDAETKPMLEAPRKRGPGRPRKHPIGDVKPRLTKRGRGRRRKSDADEKFIVVKQEPTDGPNEYVPAPDGPMVMLDYFEDSPYVELMSNESDDEWNEKALNGTIYFDPSEADNVNNFTVERLIDYNPRKKEYLVKWYGFDDKDNSWEPESNMPIRMIQEYRARKLYATEEGMQKLKEGYEALKEYEQEAKQRYDAYQAQLQSYPDEIRQQLEDCDLSKKKKKVNEAKAGSCTSDSDVSKN